MRCLLKQKIVFFFNMDPWVHLRVEDYWGFLNWRQLLNFRILISHCKVNFFPGLSSPLIPTSPSTLLPCTPTHFTLLQYINLSLNSHSLHSTAMLSIPLSTPTHFTEQQCYQCLSQLPLNFTQSFFLTYGLSK